MIYPSYDDYMRDIFYFNGLSNPNRGYGFQNPMRKHKYFN